MAEEQTAVVQDPQPPAAAAAPTPVQPAPVQPAPASQGRPWDADLAFISDPVARQAASDYLARTWQPRVTQLEQASNPQAVELWKDFHDKPEQTLLEVANDLLEPEQFQAFQQVLGQGGTPEQAQAAAEQVQTAEPAAGRDPEVQRLIDKDRAEQDEREYNEAFERTQLAHPEVKLDRARFDVFVGETGDFEQAVARYTAHEQATEAAIRERLGIAPDAPIPAAPQPPPVVGQGQAVGTTTPPVQPKKQSIGEAINDFWQEQTAKGESFEPHAPAPPVPVT